MEEKKTLCGVNDGDLQTIYDHVEHQIQANHEDLDADVHVKVDVTWDNPGNFSQPAAPALTSHPAGILSYQPMAEMQSNPATAAALTFPTFAIRDPIAHFHPQQKLMRRTRDELVKKNNKAQGMLAEMGKF